MNKEEEATVKDVLETLEILIAYDDMIMNKKELLDKLITKLRSIL